MSEQILIQCMKCGRKTESHEIEEVVLKNKRDAVQAKCAECGTKKFRMGKLPVAS